MLYLKHVSDLVSREMGVFEPRDGDIIQRQSTKSSIDKCGMRIAYQDDPGYLPVFSEQILFGTVTHAIVEQVMLEQPTLRLISSENIRIELDKAMEEYGFAVEEYLTEDDVALFIKEVREAVIAFVETWKQQCTPEKYGSELFFEELIFIPLEVLEDGRIIWLRGEPDAVFTDRIVDWKTAGRMWDDNKVTVSEQPSLYPILVARHLGWDDIYLRSFEFAIYDRSDGKWKSLYSHRDDRQLLVSWRNTILTARQMAHGLLYATPIVQQGYRRGWYCKAKWCNAWNICEYKYLEDDVDESEVATVSWRK